MIDTASIVVLVTVAIILLLLLAVWQYAKRKGRRLNDREYHIWFQKAFFGMSEKELTELPERKLQKKQGSDQSQTRAVMLER